MNFDESKDGFPTAVVQALVDELHVWRQTLPPSLQWSGNCNFDFAKINLSCEAARIRAFNLAKTAGPDELDHNVDVAVAHLRTCC